MRKLVLVIVILIAVTLIGLGALLVPAHIQVRSVANPLPPMSAFLALKDESGGPSKISYLVTASQELPDAVLAHASFVIEWADGRIFLVDTGMDANQAIEFGRMIESTLGGKETVVNGTAAELLGDDIERVAGVGFTHLHIDHTQGLVAFCDQKKSKAQLIQTDWQRNEHNHVTSEGAGILAASCLTAETISPGGLVVHEDYPGLGIAAIGGHTPGSTMYAVWIDDELFLLSGDTTNSKVEILENRGKGFFYSNFLVPEDTKRTEELRRWLLEKDQQNNITVVVSHDLADIQASGILEYSVAH